MEVVVLRDTEAQGGVLAFRLPVPFRGIAVEDRGRTGKIMSGYGADGY